MASPVSLPSATRTEDDHKSDVPPIIGDTLLGDTLLDYEVKLPEGEGEHILCWLNKSWFVNGT